jgi:peroxiredoxin
VANGGSGCADQLDRVERVRRAFPAVLFLGVISRRSLKEARSMVRKRGWGFPMLLDRDAQLLNLYGVGDCPTTVFARKGGVSAGSRLRSLSEAQLTAAVRALVQGPVVP